MQKMLHTAEEKFLVQLAKEYPTVAAASSEIINLQAILRLPKPTEHFMSDIHGEADAFAPCSMAYELYAACRSPKELLVIPGAGHAEAYYKDAERYERAVRAFLRRRNLD